jgi:NhaP-type Na+/H+ or K+/H+ antiporter
MRGLLAFLPVVILLAAIYSKQVEGRQRRGLERRSLRKYARLQQLSNNSQAKEALTDFFTPDEIDKDKNDSSTARYSKDSNNYMFTENIITTMRQAEEQDDAVEYYDDAAKYYDDAAADDNDDADDDAFQADELCTQYLVSFLEGTTDAKDNCDGIQNAYVAAYCQSQSDYNADDDHDDYFVNYNHFSCCESLQNHYDLYCKESALVTNGNLLLIASVLLLCEMAKSLIKTKNLHWLPEAGGCMIVGTFIGAIAQWVPSITLDALSFDEDLFLVVLLPPIIFEAALSVNKKEFRRRRMAIFLFAIVGTILSTFMTGYMVHFASKAIDSVTSIPLLDSLIFGALISSIDPVAILSVLTSLNLTEEDTVFIMVFGESLLNDGVAITLFNSLVSHYNSEQVNTDEILGAIADFLIIGFGSMAIGLVFGFGALLYFWCLRKNLNAPMEVASFFLWAGLPYYVCDELHLSGIVAIVTVGFFMDIYITSPKNNGNGEIVITTKGADSQGFNLNLGLSSHVSPATGNHYVDLGESIPCSNNALGIPPYINQSPSGAKSLYSARSIRSFRTLRTLNMRELLFREEKFRLSREADKHVRFCAHLLSQISENCIFVYLGLFLFSKNYDWEAPLISVSIVACLVSRAIMVMLICSLVWYINIFRQRCGCYQPKSHLLDDEQPQVSKTAAALQDRHIQLVLVLSGLRGAVSLALVESVPIYNAVTNTGTEYKGVMKAMTSGSIIFTIFVLGGSSYYILRNLDIRSADEKLNKQSNLTKMQEMPERKKKQRPNPESPMIGRLTLGDRKVSNNTATSSKKSMLQNVNPLPSISQGGQSLDTTNPFIESGTSESYDKDPHFIRSDTSFA